VFALTLGSSEEMCRAAGKEGANIEQEEQKVRGMPYRGGEGTPSHKTLSELFLT
jgi:hypothetical protein